MAPMQTTMEQYLTHDNKLGYLEPPKKKVKKGKKILWRAVEMPSKLVLKESFFEEDIKPVVKFQNKNKTFGIFGFPPFFDCRSEEEKIADKGKTNYNSPARSRGRR